MVRKEFHVSTFDVGDLEDIGPTNFNLFLRINEDLKISHKGLIRTPFHRNRFVQGVPSMFFFSKDLNGGSK